MADHARQGNEKLVPDDPRAPARCPRCDSPSPHLHPAMQFEGEVQECSDAFHDRVTPQNTAERIAERKRQSLPRAPAPQGADSLEQRLADIRLYEQRATKGPWFDHHIGDVHTVSHWRAPATDRAAQSVAGPMDQHDAYFIAHAREDIPALLDCGSAQQGEINRLRAELETAKADGHQRIEQARVEAENLLLRKDYVSEVRHR